ncbi:hypothetical protein DPMN_009644 [Dreissena polymorpha]|uniref:Uncharacterized protein n=1 Tax=Dreissena polymorpha TaxID=45954 RepID=A0A9D4N1M9_DREPO|nr:hypothetical protein DPMN_009644 [Dreissena polymorpha]
MCQQSHQVILMLSLSLCSPWPIYGKELHLLLVGTLTMMCLSFCKKRNAYAYDIYITGILSVMEKVWQDNTIGMKIARVLSVAGNYFLPKMHSISHLKTAETYSRNPAIKSGLFHTEKTSDTSDIRILFSIQQYKELIKAMYCQKQLHASQFTYGEIR